MPRSWHSADGLEMWRLFPLFCTFGCFWSFSRAQGNDFIFLELLLKHAGLKYELLTLCLLFVILNVDGFLSQV